MNTSSIQFRLILWYSGLVVLVSLAFGAYTYHGVKTRLYAEMEQTLTRRATHIVQENLPKNLNEIASQIEEVYSPEASNRFIRILGENNAIIYVSGKPKDGNFSPKELPFPAYSNKNVHFLPLDNGSQMMLVEFPVKQSGKSYLIEMGTLTDDAEIALHGLVTTLLIGLPIVVLITSLGGYILVRRALQPVEDIRATAESITFGNLNNRLPVVNTGDALEHLSVTLNQMLDRLEDAYLQVSRFSADASHELRTPLTIMRGELEAMIREQNMSTEIQEKIGSVLEETEHLSRITENLFFISRLDAGEAKTEHIKLDLAALVKNTAEQMALLAEDKKITLHIQTKEPVFVYGDVSRIKQVIVNLLDNSIKYTLNNGTVFMYVRAIQNKAVFEVIDNGIGIEKSALPYVFERFYRANKACSRESGGAGLGLSIVRSIVQAHGGEVIIESNEGVGTNCQVKLPLAKCQD